MRTISKAELARWAGVSRQAITKVCRPGGALYDATGSDGVDVSHPLVREWLDSHGVADIPTGDPGPGGKTRKAPAKPAASKAAKPAESDPAESEDLENLTVREVVMRYGSVDGFKRFVDSLKNIAEYKYRELRIKQQRGDLVERAKVAGLVFPLIDVTFSRLVTDIPDAVSKLVIARVESGGPETLVDVQKIIRDANSRAIKNLKQSALKLEILKDANRI